MDCDEETIEVLYNGAYGGYGITDKGIKHLGKCHTLQLDRDYYIKFKGFPKISDKGLKYLGNCHTLIFGRCDKITDNGVKYLGKCNTLDLSLCENITTVGYSYLVNCHKVQKYRISEPCAFYEF